jgi:cytoskeletal protein RodZ
MPLSVGEQLKSARSTRNASIEDVSRALHIKPFFIEALEENRFSDIPSQAQVKGFIRLYAGWLELPVQPLFDILEGKTILPEPEPVGPIAPSVEPVEVIKSETPSVPSEEISRTSQTKSKNLQEINPEIDTSSQEEIQDQLSQTTSQQLFDQIGIQLKSCREKLNISVEEIEKLTHIRSRYLADMESGNFNNIPSMVQARGLLNGYSSFLNLDTDALLSLFADALQMRRLELIPSKSDVDTKKAPKKKKAAAPKTERTGIRRFLTLDFIFGSLTIFGVVAIAIFAAIQVTSNPSSSESKPPPISDVLRDNPAANTTQIATPTIVTAVEARNPDSIGLMPTNKPNEDAAPADGTLTPAVPSLGNESMQVYIVPNQRVFLQVITGKKTVFLGRTVPGNAYPFTSNERIEVICGNAAGVQVYYNQRDLGTLGLPGQPLHLIFNKNGVVTPTSAVTAAPTSTPLATLTLRPTATKAPPTVTPLIP